MTPGSGTTNSPTRRDQIRWSLLIFAFALVVRGLAVWQLADSLLFETLLGDALNYDRRGRVIAGGDWIGSEVFYQAPLYSYFLAVIYALISDDRLVVRGLQIILGAASCALLTQAGWRFFSKPVGIAAGLLLAVYAPAIYSDAIIEKSVLDVFLVCLALWFLGGIQTHTRTGQCLGLGLSIGVLVLSRENALVFAVVLLPWLVLRSGPSRRQRLGHAAAFAAGMAVVLSPVALRNWHVGGEFYLTTSQFGHNFFIGNNEAADGAYAPVVYRRGDPRLEIQDAIDLAERAMGRKLTPAEVSDYYFRRATDYIRSQPGDWIKLMARKLVLTFNAVEMVDTKDQYSHADASLVLRSTGWLFHLGVMAPLALLGVWVTWADRRRLLPLHLLFLAYTAALVTFYVFARYRMPLVPILALFAAAGVVRFPGFARTSRPPQIAACIAATVAAAIFCNWPILDKDYMRSVTQYNLGNELFARGRADEATERYRDAIRLYPGNAMANHNLGVLFARGGDLVQARVHYEEAVRISPNAALSRLNLARTLSELGDTQGAIESYRLGLRLTGERADVYNELGLVYLEGREWARAVESFERALSIDPNLGDARRNLARARDGQARGERDGQARSEGGGQARGERDGQARGERDGQARGERE